MVKPTWGIKRNCQSCAARFYDLNKAPIKCPKCGREHDREDFVKVRRGRAGSAAAAAAAAATAAAAAAKALAARKKLEETDDVVPEVEGDEALEDADDDAEEIEVAIEDKEESS